MLNGVDSIRQHPLNVSLDERIRPSNLEFLGDQSVAALVVQVELGQFQVSRLSDLQIHLRSWYHGHRHSRTFHY